jgi:hypothetical protein
MLALTLTLAFVALALVLALALALALVLVLVLRVVVESADNAVAPDEFTRTTETAAISIIDC